MKTKTLIMVFLTIILVSCGQTSTPNPTNAPPPTATFTPEPTATPVPIEVSGLLFLDANGSGLRDKASFICPEVNATPESLEYFFPEVCTVNNIGQLITIQEPSLKGMSVCYKENCTTTGTDGIFSLMVSGISAEQSVNLKVNDPNAQTPALALRYFNKWNKAVLIPPYNINGIDIPEQNLNDTSIISSTNDFSVKVNAKNEIGLIQGVLTLPFSSDSTSCLKLQWYDWNFSKNSVVNWFGSTERSNIGSPDGKTYDGHRGTDYFCKIGTSALATGSGIVNDINGGGSNSLNLFLDHAIKEDNGIFWSIYGHLNKTVILANDHIFRGQKIGETGISGTQVAHLHFNPLTGNGYSAPPDDFIGAPTLFQRDAFAIMLPSDMNVPDNLQKVSQYSMWTVYNLPVFSETR